MERNVLTFERVKKLYECGVNDPAVSVQELAGVVKLVYFANDVDSGIEIRWLMEVVRNCGHEEVAVVATSAIAMFANREYSYTICSRGCDAHPLEIVQFFANEPACSRISGKYKKAAIDFLHSWWKEVLNSKTLLKGTEEDTVSFYARYRDWTKALAGAFLNLKSWEHLREAGVLYFAPELYQLVLVDRSQNWNMSNTFPCRLVWPHWGELPVFVREWQAIYSSFPKGEPASKLNALLGEKPALLLEDEEAIKLLCGYMLTMDLYRESVHLLLTLLTTFQHLRQASLK